MRKQGQNPTCVATLEADGEAWLRRPVFGLVDRIYLLYSGPPLE